MKMFDCPHCGGEITINTLDVISDIGTGMDIYCCVFCGNDLDEDLIKQLDKV